EAVLHPLVARQPFELGDLDGLRELVSREVRGADGADRAGANQVGEGLQGLLLRRLRVEVVREVERDAFDAEAAPADLMLPPDATPSHPVVEASLPGLDRLLRPHDAVAHIGPLRRDPLADQRLTAAAAVGVRRVERRDAVLPAEIHDAERVLARRAP